MKIEKKTIVDFRIKDIEFCFDIENNEACIYCINIININSNKGLKEIIIPNNVTNIGALAFVGCIELEKIFIENQDYKNLFVTILSFGFKYGIPSDSDIVMDVRFLPNPYYVEGLRAKTGNDKEIQDYVMQFPEAREFLNKFEDMIHFLIPNYISEGKNQLVISIGCTGGKHRSVTLANELYKRLEGKKEYGLKIEHRDIEKDALRGK